MNKHATISAIEQALDFALAEARKETLKETLDNAALVCEALARAYRRTSNPLKWLQARALSRAAATIRGLDAEDAR